jgi:hypothetical protein
VLWKTYIYITHVSGVDSLILGLAVHFLFVSVLATLERHFKDGHGNTITSVSVENYDTFMGYVSERDSESPYVSCVRFWLVEFSAGRVGMINLYTNS